LLNLSNLSNETGISVTTIKEWFSILQASYIVFPLPPYHPRNLKKRLVKSKSILLYAGDIEQDRSDIKIINYRHLPDILETIN
jgi:predicted AAA+ superfamily ATPase